MSLESLFQRFDEHIVKFRKAYEKNATNYIIYYAQELEDRFWKNILKKAQKLPQTKKLKEKLLTYKSLLNEIQSMAWDKVE